jgi:hypothetical protein
VTPGGAFIWTTSVLGLATLSHRFMVAPGGSAKDCHANLTTFCDDFLASMSVPPSRRLYDVQSVEDIAQLSVQLMRVGTGRVKHTVGITSGLA